MSVEWGIQQNDGVKSVVIPESPKSLPGIPFP